MSNPGERPSHGFSDQSKPVSGSPSAKATARRGRALYRALLVCAALASVIEVSAYYSGILQIWESYLLTPSVPMLVTLALFVSLEITQTQPGMGSHQIQDDLSKSVLMVLGGTATLVGVGVFMASVSTDLHRVILDTAAGSTIICAGIYAVKRFSW